MSDVALTVDLGGTNLRYALITREGKMLERHSSPSPTGMDPEAAIFHIAKGLVDFSRAHFSKAPSLVGVGMGIPGIFDPKSGILHASPHFPAWKNVPFQTLLNQSLPWPVTLDNDANRAALGEMVFGAGKELEHFILLTLGTGIGGGLVLNRQIWSGDHGFAGELGHIVVEAGGVHCPCGSKGCLEMYVSTLGLKRHVQNVATPEELHVLLQTYGEGFSQLPIKVLAEQARKNITYAVEAFRRMGNYLGIGLASIVHVLGIEHMILGGGISQAWDLFIPSMEKSFREHSYAETSRRVRFHQAALGEDAGLLGNAVAVFRASLDPPNPP